MERVLSSLLASLCAAPLCYFVTSWLVITLNQDTHGPDDRLAVAYGSTFSGFAAAFVGFFLVWFLTQRFLVPNHLRAVQLFGAAALIGWLIVYMNYANQQPKRLKYYDLQPVLDVELKATKTLLGQRSIDSVLSMNYCGGLGTTIGHPEPIREEAEAVILSIRTVPYDVKQWEMCVFLRDQLMLFPLELPQRPTQSTDWSGWIRPVQYQDQPLPELALDNLTLRYRFRLVPYGQQP